MPHHWTRQAYRHIAKSMWTFRLPLPKLVLMDGQIRSSLSTAPDWTCALQSRLAVNAYRDVPGKTFANFRFQGDCI